MAEEAAKAVTSTSWFDPMRIAITVVIISILIYFLRRRPDSFLTPDALRDVVLLHQLGHGVQCPSLSPFALKVETYLRINNITYQSLYDRKMGPKGKSPWIEYNGDVIPDSSFIIAYLNNKFNVNMNANLTSEQQGVAKALQRLAEDSLYFQIGLWRAVYDEEKETFRAIGLNAVYIWMLERKAQSDAYHQGIGRHSQEEVAQITEADLKALSNILGEKDYFFGSRPTEVDCTLFGHLSQLVWQAHRSPGEKLIHEKFPNLKTYCERIKDKYWPDWNELILQPPSE